MVLAVGIRALGTHRIGRAALMALAIATLVGGLFYLGPYFDIAVFLLFGLAVPIYLGWKIPRQLAVAGLATILISAPLFSTAYAYQLRQPSPLADSHPAGNSGWSIQHAHVAPYTGVAGGNYTFSATVAPQNPPKGQSPDWLVLYVSDCPGATGKSSLNCPGGYKFFELNHTFGPNVTTSTPVEFHQVLPGSDVWWWTMALTTHQGYPRSNVTTTWLYGIQGPVSGDFLSTMELVIPAAYEILFLYPGLVFYVGLLVYMLLKSREAARKRRTLPPAPPGALSGSSGTPSTGQAPATPATTEVSCPNCHAVVYPNESTCWKCGAKLTAGDVDGGKTLP